MQEVLIGDSKHRYHYQSFPNDKEGRDNKARIVKSQGFKKISTGHYTAQDGKTIYYLTRE